MEGGGRGGSWPSLGSGRGPAPATDCPTEPGPGGSARPAGGWVNQLDPRAPMPRPHVGHQARPVHTPSHSNIFHRSRPLPAPTCGSALSPQARSRARARPTHHPAAPPAPPSPPSPPSPFLPSCPLSATSWAAPSAWDPEASARAQPLAQAADPAACSPHSLRCAGPTLRGGREPRGHSAWLGEGSPKRPRCKGRQGGSDPLWSQARWWQARGPTVTPITCAARRVHRRPRAPPGRSRHPAGGRAALGQGW